MNHFIRLLKCSILALLLVGATACNTIEGAGEDIESAGDNIEDAAD